MQSWNVVFFDALPFLCLWIANYRSNVEGVLIESVEGSGFLQTKIQDV